MIKTARLNIFKELRLQAWLRFFHRHDKSGETTWLHSFHFLVNTIFMCRTTGDSEIRTRDLLNVISPPWLSIVMVPKCICNSGLVVVEQTSFLHSTTLKAMRTQHTDNGEKIPLHSYHVIFPQKRGIEWRKLWFWFLLSNCCLLRLSFSTHIMMMCTVYLYRENV